MANRAATTACRIRTPSVGRKTGRSSMLSSSPLRRSLPVEHERHGWIAPYAGNRFCAGFRLGGVLATVEVKRNQRGRIAPGFRGGTRARERAAAIFFPTASQPSVAINAGEVICGGAKRDFDVQGAVAVNAPGEMLSLDVEANAAVASSDGQRKIRPVVREAVPVAAGGLGRCWSVRRHRIEH